MIKRYTLDPRINKKPEEFLNEFVVIRVNSFNEASAKEFSEQLSKAHTTGQEVVPIIIDSYGGQVYSLMSMISEMHKSKLKHMTILEGKAMSCGGILFGLGTPGMRYMADFATLLLHEPFTLAYGTNNDLEVSAAELTRLANMIFRLLDKNCGQDLGFFQNLIHDNNHADLYLSAKDCKKFKLADVIGTPIMETTVTIQTTFK